MKLSFGCGGILVFVREARARRPEYRAALFWSMHVSLSPAVPLGLYKTDHVFVIGIIGDNLPSLTHSDLRLKRKVPLLALLILTVK